MMKLADAILRCRSPVAANLVRQILQPAAVPTEVPRWGAVHQVFQQTVFAVVPAAIPPGHIIRRGTRHRTLTQSMSGHRLLV